MTLRLRCPNQTIRLDDWIQGGFAQNLAVEVGDFIIQRADGVYAYHLAVVVDDADAGITHIVRGRDLLDSTPRQILLQQLLTKPTPRYAHLPLANHPDGSKLSKQTGAAAIDRATRPGELLVAALHLLGQQPDLTLAKAPPATIIDWASEHWQINRVPTALSSVSDQSWHE